MKQIKIIRGYYLTGLGQESHAYYFKMPASHAHYNTLKSGDVAISFYQNGDAITSIPALIRVDSIFESEKHVSEFLRSEKKDGLPMLPIVGLYEHFDPICFKRMMEVREEMVADIKRLAKVEYVQGDLFDYCDEEESWE